MVPKRDSDDPTTPIGAVTRWAIQLGVLGALVAVVAALMWLVFQMSAQNQSTSKQLVDVTATAVDKLPTIAAEMRDDNRRDGEFMRQHTAAAVTARDQMAVKLAAIETQLASIRSEQQATGRALLEAVDRLIRMQQDGPPKNELPSLDSRKSGDNSNG